MRHHGEGTIYKDNIRGRWVACVSCGLREDGRRWRRYAYATTRRDAVAALRRLQKESAARQEPSKESVVAYIRRYLETYHANATATTKATRENSIRAIKEAGGGALRVCDATRPKLQIIINRLAEKYSAGTLRNIGGLLLSAMRAAEMDGLGAHPGIIKLPAARSKEVPTIPAPELLHKIQSTFGAELDGAGVPLYALLLYTGARRGELCGLRWEDYDAEGHILHIRRQIIRHPNGGYEEADTKTHRGREVPVPRPLCSVLDAWGNAQRKRLLSLGCIPSGQILQRGNGQILTPDKITRVCEKVGESLGIALSPHMFRHWYASQLVGDNVPIKAVQAALGHTLAKTTLDTYAQTPNNWGDLIRLSAVRLAVSDK